MGKYELLQRHLGQIDTDVRITMTFEEVAQWVPGGLPSTAFRNPRWWANEPSSSQVHAEAWVRTGWLVEAVDLDDGTVTFERTIERTIDGAADQTVVLDRTGLSAPGANGSSTYELLPGLEVNGHSNGTPPSIAPTSIRAMEQLVGLLGGGRVSGLLSEVATELYGADAEAAGGVATSAGFTPKLLSEAFTLRSHLGQLNDLIHAAAMTMALPHILEPNEVVAQPPWLAANGDRAHTFDLETNRRVADFKLAVWTGKDAARKRALFQGLVHLAALPADQRPELYVAGAAPLDFLRGSGSNAAWALNRGPESTKSLYLVRFQDLGMSIRDFTAGPAAHVKLTDLSDVLPPMQTALSA
jgi:hypothetical protein